MDNPSCPACGHYNAMLNGACRDCGHRPLTAGCYWARCTCPVTHRIRYFYRHGGGLIEERHACAEHVTMIAGPSDARKEIEPIGEGR